jgi:hypothetical protein
MPAAKKGTYLIEFWNGQKFIVGNNYKEWWRHAIELANDRYREVSNHQMFKSVEYSRVPFVDNGGLKYCAADHYQQLIDEVAAKYGKDLTPFKDYKFEKQAHELGKLDRELVKW